jgi:hypothetical protein
LLPLIEDRAQLSQLAALCEGWDGRRIRKLVLAALAQRVEVARDPSTLSWEDLITAAREEGRGGVGRRPRAHVTRDVPRRPRELMHDHDHGHTLHDHQHGHDHDHPHSHRHTQTHQNE